MKACSSRLGLTLGVGRRPVRKERGDGREREGGREEGGREGEGGGGREKGGKGGEGGSAGLLDYPQIQKDLFFKLFLFWSWDSKAGKARLGLKRFCKLTIAAVCVCKHTAFSIESFPAPGTGSPAKCFGLLLDTCVEFIVCKILTPRFFGKSFRLAEALSFQFRNRIWLGALALLLVRLVFASAS